MLMCVVCMCVIKREKCKALKRVRETRVYVRACVTLLQLRKDSGSLVIVVVSLCFREGEKEIKRRREKG